MGDVVAWILQWGPGLLRLLEILVDTFWYKGILLIYNWSGFAWVETSARGTPNIDCSRFTNSVSLLYHKEAVYRFLYRSNYKKSKNQLYSDFASNFWWNSGYLNEQYRQWPVSIENPIETRCRRWFSHQYVLFGSILTDFRVHTTQRLIFRLKSSQSIQFSAHSFVIT